MRWRMPVIEPLTLKRISWLLLISFAKLPRNYREMVLGFSVRNPTDEKMTLLVLVQD